MDVKRPEPILSGERIEMFDLTSDVELAIKILEKGKPVLITKLYSNGSFLLKELHTHLKRKLPNRSFQEQREYRSEYRKLSNLILIEIVDHRLKAKKSPTIGWFEKIISRN